MWRKCGHDIICDLRWRRTACWYGQAWYWRCYHATGQPSPITCTSQNWTAMESYGNIATGKQKIAVLHTLDSMNSVPGDITLLWSERVDTGYATATCTYGNDIDILHSDITVSKACLCTPQFRKLTLEPLSSYQQKLSTLLLARSTSVMVQDVHFPR